jgi:hypothetical protein
MISKDKTRVLVTMPQDMKDDLDILADTELRNVSNYCVAVLKAHIDEKKAKNPELFKK